MSDVVAIAYPEEHQAAVVRTTLPDYAKARIRAALAHPSDGTA
jgi:hypothetical protein